MCVVGKKVNVKTRCGNNDHNESSTRTFLSSFNGKIWGRKHCTHNTQESDSSSFFSSLFMKLWILYLKDEYVWCKCVPACVCVPILCTPGGKKEKNRNKHKMMRKNVNTIRWFEFESQREIYYKNIFCSYSLSSLSLTRTFSLSCISFIISCVSTSHIRIKANNCSTFNTAWNVLKLDFLLEDARIALIKLYDLRKCYLLNCFFFTLLFLFFY